MPAGMTHEERMAQMKKDAEMEQHGQIVAQEKDLLKSVERGEWKSATGGRREQTRYTRVREGNITSRIVG